MKLSEAIRIGAALRPQGFGRYFSHNDQQQLCSCNLGAAAEAAFGSYLWPTWDKEIAIKLHEEFPLDALVKHPVTGGQMRLDCILANLNDVHLWTREKSAEWAEGEGY